VGLQVQEGWSFSVLPGWQPMGAWLEQPKEQKKVKR